MKLSLLLKEHTAATAEVGHTALTHNLGDGYLLRNNKIYAAIRQQALNIDCKFTTEVSRDYVALPLSQIEDLINRTSVPFHDNVSVLLELEKRRPGQITWNHIADNLKQNHVLHESCHIVARTHSKSTGLWASAIKDEPLHLLTVLLEEAFANTCELVGIAYADNAVHRTFYELNSYIFMHEDRVNLCRGLENFERHSFFCFLHLCYVHANFLNDSWSDSDFKKALSLSFGANHKLSPAEIKTLRALGKNSFALNPRFREVTSELYLKLTGFTKNSVQDYGIDHLDMIEKRPELKNWLKALLRQVPLL